MAAEPPPPGYYAPAPYGLWWLWIGVAAFVLIGGWYLWVWWATRPRPTPSAPHADVDRSRRLRDDYLREIDLVVSRAAAGAITDRRAHQELSVLVRHFVQEMSGIRAPTMTLTDLTESGPRLTAVAQVVEVLYPGEFAPRATQTVAGAGEVAKEVVRRWS